MRPWGGPEVRFDHSILATLALGAALTMPADVFSQQSLVLDYLLTENDLRACNVGKRRRWRS